MRHEVTSTSAEHSVLEFGSLMVTFAVMRCREQADFEESERLWGEYLDGVAAINSRYGGGLPWENIPGDRR